MGTQEVGKASFTYTVVGATSGVTTVTLGSPLHDISPGFDRAEYVADSADLSQRKVFTIGDGRHTVDGLVRFHDTPQDLLDMLDNARAGQVLTYFHTTSSTGIACRLTGGGNVTLDADWDKRYQVRLTLRRSTTGDWSAIL
jgi:hypothetical protein